MLGVMLGCTGITQLICPAIGYTSDRSTSRYGRRRPTMVAGALIACLGHCCMLACHHYRIGHLYLVSLTVAVFGMNCWCTAASSHRYPAPSTTSRAAWLPLPPPPRPPASRACTPRRPCARSYACYTALLPDFVLPEHMGKARALTAGRHRVAASRT